MTTNDANHRCPIVQLVNKSQLHSQEASLCPVYWLRNVRRSSCLSLEESIAGGEAHSFDEKAG
jgi:hypothetical protein